MTTPPLRTRLARRLAPLLAALPVLLAVSGCFNPFRPAISTSRGLSSPAPVPSSPANAVRLLEWCYNNQDITLYSQLLTADYEFVFALADSAGNAFRDRVIRRDDDIDSATNLFVGGGDRPPASRITCSFDRTLIALADGRPGKDPRWHKSVFTEVSLSVLISEGESQSSLEVQGKARFFLVRGDSARIPDVLQQQGFRSDSLRWWIERWEDETLPSLVFDPGTVRVRQVGAEPAATRNPLQVLTLGGLKALFWDSPPFASRTAAAQVAPARRR